VSRICPELPISAAAAVCLRIGGQKLTQILSVYTKISLAAGDQPPPQTPLGELMMLPQTPTSDPRRLATVALAPYDWHLRCLSRGAQIMATLLNMSAKVTLWTRHLWCYKLTQSQWDVHQNVKLNILNKKKAEIKTVKQHIPSTYYITLNRGIGRLAVCYMRYM